MDHGHKAMFDTTERVFSQAETLKKSGLSVPAVTQIALKLREKGLDIGPVYTVEQAIEKLVPLLKGGDVDA